MVQTSIAVQLCKTYGIMVYSQCKTFLQAVTFMPGQDHKQNPEEFIFFLTSKQCKEIYLKVLVTMSVDRQIQLTAVKGFEPRAERLKSSDRNTKQT